MLHGRGRHTSLEKELKPEIEWLESLPQVARVILGRAESCRHAYGPGTLRVKREENHGVKLAGYTGKGIIDIFVTLTNGTSFENVKTIIEERHPA